MVKTCPKCGKTFDCVHSCTCWCSTIKLSKGASEYLKANFGDCLCRDCMIEVSKAFPE